MASCLLVAHPQGRRWLSGGLAPHPSHQTCWDRAQGSAGERSAQPPSLGPNLRSRASQLLALGKFPGRPVPLPLCPSVSRLERRAGDNACLQPRWPVPGTESAPRPGPQSRQSCRRGQREGKSRGSVSQADAWEQEGLSGHDPMGGGTQKAVPAPRVAHSQITPAPSPRDLRPTLQMQKLRPREKSSMQTYGLPPASLPGGDPPSGTGRAGFLPPLAPWPPPTPPRRQGRRAMVAPAGGDQGTGSWGRGIWKGGQREGEPEAPQLLAQPL